MNNEIKQILNKIEADHQETMKRLDGIENEVRGIRLMIGSKQERSLIKQIRSGMVYGFVLSWAVVPALCMAFN